jgi:hypothetical protein
MDRTVLRAVIAIAAIATLTLSTGAVLALGASGSAHASVVGAAKNCVQSDIPLGADNDVRVLAATTVTSTGATFVGGNIDLSPGSSITGFPPGTLSGVEHISDPIAVTAQQALGTAYKNGMHRATCGNYLAGNIGGTSLSPGLYTANTSLAISSGDLILNAHGNHNAVFIFQIGTTFKTSGGFGVLLRGGALASHVYWVVGTSVTLGTGSTVHGFLLAHVSITMDTGAVLHGRALAKTGAVTLDANQVTC